MKDITFLIPYGSGVFLKLFPSIPLLPSDILTRSSRIIPVWLSELNGNPTKRPQTVLV
jgi:hypothetical protein